MTDRLLMSRLVLAGAILVLLVLGAVQPETYPVWQATILIPGTFLVLALLLLLLPVLAEQGISRSKAGHFFKHSNFVWIAGAFVLGAAAFVAVQNHANMTVVERVVFYGAVAAGLGSLLVQHAIGLADKVKARPDNPP